MDENTNQITKQIMGLNVVFKKNVALQDFTSTHTGGKIPFMFYPTNIKELVGLIKFFKMNSLNFIVLGEMANIAVSSENLNLIVVNMSHYLKTPFFDEKSGIVTVSAGYKMKQLCKWATRRSISGLQWMEGNSWDSWSWGIYECRLSFGTRF